MFVICEEVQEFQKGFIIYHLELLLKDCENSVNNVLDLDEVLLTIFPDVTININSFFVNFFISIFRFTVYKRRQILLQNN